MILHLLQVIFILSISRSAKQTFRCLIQAKSPQRFFINLTFNSNQALSDTSGHLTKLEVDYFDFRDNIPKMMTPIGDGNATIKKNYFSRTDYDLYTIRNKNNNLMNLLKIENRRTKTNLIQIGIPIPINSEMMRIPVERSTHDSYLHTNGDYINFNGSADFRLYMNYLFPLSYSIVDSSVQHFFSEDPDYEVVMCKEIVVNKKDKQGFREGISIDTLFKLLVNKHRVLTRHEEVYNKYDRLFNDSYVTKNIKKHGVVIHADRLKTNEMASFFKHKEDAASLSILPSFDGDFGVTFMLNTKKAYSLIPEHNDNEDYKLLMYRNMDLIGALELKKIDKNGSNLLRYKR